MHFVWTTVRFLSTLLCLWHHRWHHRRVTEAAVRLLFCLFLVTVCGPTPTLLHPDLFPCCFSFFKLACLFFFSPPPSTAWPLSPTCCLAGRTASAGTVLSPLTATQLQPHAAFPKYLLARRNPSAASRKSEEIQHDTTSWCIQMQHVNSRL